MSEENTPQPPHSFLQLIEPGTDALIKVLDVAIKKGSHDEARQALQFLALIGDSVKAIKKQLEDAKTEAAKVETPTKKTKDAA